MKEWSKQNEYNSFNPWKGLLYAPQYEKLAKMEVPVPIQARIDPTLRCPLNCEWCNSARYRAAGDELSGTHIRYVLDFISRWGVKAVVWAGGGEPTYHPDFLDLLQRNIALHMDAAILTNGVIHDEVVADAIGRLCRWAGVSIDAGSPETYTKLKGADGFGIATNSIAVMAAADGNCDVGYKFLISPGNQHEIALACSLAKDIGATNFIARPMDVGHQGMDGSKTFDVADFNTAEILKQFEECHKLETTDFHVYTVVHKFNADFSNTHDFENCYGAALRLHIATDGNVYFCDDQYYQPEYVLGPHYPYPDEILRFWGKGRHLELLYGKTPAKCKTRCCVSDYCQQCEKLFVKDGDPLCRWYP